MSLTKSDVALLGNLARGREYGALERLVETMIQDIRGQPTVGDTEFAYLKDGLMKDGMIVGLHQLLREITKAVE